MSVVAAIVIAVIILTVALKVLPNTVKVNRVQVFSGKGLVLSCRDYHSHQMAYDRYLELSSEHLGDPTKRVTISYPRIKQP